MLYEVENFTYNGFMVKSRKGKAKYKAEFVSWTNDPGIALCNCTDGEKRLIPSCCLIGSTKNGKSLLPIRTENNNLLFGTPSSSR